MSDISEKVHDQKIAFHTFKRHGVQYIAFREYGGTTIFDDQFNNYGSFRSLDSFLERTRKEGKIEPIGKIECLSARLRRDP